MHAYGRTGLHRGIQLCDLTLPDHVRNRGRVDEYFGRDGSTAVLGQRQQGLAGFIPATCPLTGCGSAACLVRRKYVDDAVDALRRALGVQSGEY